MEFLIALGVVAVIGAAVYGLFNIKTNTQKKVDAIETRAKEFCETSNQTSGQFAVKKADIPKGLYNDLASDLNSVKQLFVKWQKKGDKCQYKICLVGKSSTSAARKERCSPWFDVP